MGQALFDFCGAASERILRSRVPDCPKRWPAPAAQQRATALARSAISAWGELVGRIILNPPVATGSLIIVAALLLFGGVWPDTASRIFEDVQSWVLNTFGWLYVLAVASYTVAALIFALSRFGQIKLGPDDSEPEFSFVG